MASPSFRIEKEVMETTQGSIMRICGGHPWSPKHRLRCGSHLYTHTGLITNSLWQISIQSHVEWYVICNSFITCPCTLFTWRLKDRDVQLSIRHLAIFIFNETTSQELYGNIIVYTPPPHWSSLLSCDYTVAGTAMILYKRAPCCDLWPAGYEANQDIR